MNQNHGYCHQRDHVYTRELQIGITSSEEPVMTQQLVIFSRYALPTEDAVVDYLVEKAASVSTKASLIIPGQEVRLDLSPLECTLLVIHPQIRQDLIQRSAECIQFVRQNTLAMNGAGDQPTPYFLRGEIGYIPVDFAFQEDDDVRKVASTVLRNRGLLEQDAGLKGFFTLALGPEAAPLPHPAEMNVLLKHGVRESATLSIKGAVPLYSLVSALDLLYSIPALSLPGGFSYSFPDESQNVLEEYCTPAVAGLLKLSEQMKAQQRPVIDPRTVPRGLDLLKR